MKKLFSLGLAILLMASTGAFAQTATGNVLGVVTDASGAVLPGVAVAISRWRRAGPGADSWIAVLRRFPQLDAIGLVITATSDVDRFMVVLGVPAGVVRLGAFPTGGLARPAPGAVGPLVPGSRPGEPLSAPLP